MPRHEHGQTPSDDVHRGPLKTITLERTRCPRCKSIDLKKYRSLRDQGDGSALSWVRCTDCGERFRVLLE